MPRERRGMIPGIHVIQDNTNDTKTGEPEKPEFMPWGLAFSTDVHCAQLKQQEDHYQLNIKLL